MLCLGYYLYVYAEARLYQSFEDRELDTILASRSESSPPGAAESAIRSLSGVNRITFSHYEYSSF